MSAGDRAFWNAVHRRAAALEPDIARDILRAFRILRESLSDAELAKLIAAGRLDALIDDKLMDRAFLPLRARIQATTERSFDLTRHSDLPRSGKINGQVAVSFDTLNPKVIDAVRELDSRAVNTLKDEIRDTVRAHVENGLREGTPPRTLARDLRGVIGLAPNQEAYIRNLRQELTEGRFGDASRRRLLDQRFNLDKLAEISPAEQTARIDRITDSYRKAWVAQNAETNARTATLDSVKLGQKLSWDDAIAKGVVDPSKVWRRWVATKDGRTREEHLAMDGEEVRHDDHFSNGELVPGESTFNCRCVALYLIKREPVAQAA